MPPKSSSKRSLRALEMLDKHISKRSSKKNEQSAASLPWLNSQNLSTMMENNHNNPITRNNLKIKISPKNQHDINNQSDNDNKYGKSNNNETPTPKRRKTVTQNKTVTRQLFNPSTLAETEDEDNNNLNSSPIKKTVSFSDHIEIDSSPFKNNLYLNDSPTGAPHPRHDFDSVIASLPRSNKSPPKSILKNKSETTKSENVSKILSDHNQIKNKNETNNSSTNNNSPSQFKINNSNILSLANKDNSTIDNSNLHTTIASTDIDSHLMNPAFAKDDPFQIEYWSNGEIHSLSDNKNLTEFKNIIVGGLYILQNNSYPYNEKRFEIYATFNNIVPVITRKNISDLNEKKINILIDNLSKIIKICIPQWNLTQKKLLHNDITINNTNNNDNVLVDKNGKVKGSSKNEIKKTDDKNDTVVESDQNYNNHEDNDNPKDPFVARLYHQIVKFFTILLSNFKIVQWLSDNNNLKSEIKIIYQYSIDALTDSKANKPILISNLTFLKEEKFYTYYATRPEVVNLIHAIPNIKIVYSQNYMLEKVYYVKSLLNKFPNLMIKHMNTWLCGDLLPQIIIEYDANFEKVSIASISLLLDLLKKIYDTSNTSIKELYSTIVNTPVKKVLPPKYYKKLKQTSTDIPSIPKDINMDVITLEILLFHHIMYLLQTKKSYKIAMDLWLTLVGILFSNAATIQTFININIKTNKWLTLNKTCFGFSSNKAKLLALKSWRILIYPICMNMHKFSPEERVKCYEILDIPYSMSQNAIFSQSILTGISFTTRAITYTIACYLHNSKSSIDSSSTLFCDIWKKLFIPTFERVLSFKSPNCELQKLIFDILIKLLGNTVAVKQTSLNYKDISSKTQQVFPIKVIATTGIRLNEIPSLPTNLQNVWYPMIKDFATTLIKEYGKDNECLPLLRTLINRTPETQINSPTFIELTELVSFYLMNLCHLPVNSTDVFYSLSLMLFKKFSSLLFTEGDKHLTNYFGHFKMINFNNNDIIVKLLKDMIKSTRNQLPELLIFYKFLDPSNEQCYKYIVNWLSSTLLSPTMDSQSFKVLIDIIRIIPDTSIIDNFLTIFPRMEQPYFDILFSKCISWSPNSLQHFINGCLFANDPRLLKFTVDLIKELSHFQYSLFINTLPTLYKKGQNTFIQEYILDHPDILETMEPILYPYVHKDSEQSLLPFLIQNISKVPNGKKSYILDRLLKEEGLISVINKSELFSSLLFKSSSSIPIDDQKRLILKILNNAYEKMNWDVFSNVIQQTLHSADINYVEMFFSNHNARVYEIMNYFPISLIVNLCSTGGKIDSLIDQAISQMFKHKDVDFIISLIRAFLNSKKYNNLNKFIDNTVSFLFDDTIKLSEIQKTKKLKLFRDILTEIQTYDSDILVKILNSVVSLCPFTKSDFKMELLESTPEVLGKESEKPYSIHQVNKILSELERLQKIDMKTSNITKKNKAELICTLFEEESIENAQNQVGNKYEIQMPATQKSDTALENVLNKAALASCVNTFMVNGKIITSSNSISYDEDKSLEKEKDNVKQKNDIKKQGGLSVGTSTQISPTQYSIQQPLLDAENENSKTKDIEKISSSFPEEVDSEENKFVGSSDISSTIEEIEKLSQINKNKTKLTKDATPGVDIHRIFQASGNKKLSRGSAVISGQPRPLSSPLSKEVDPKNVKNALSFSSPVKRNVEDQSVGLEGLSLQLAGIYTPHKKQKVDKAHDDHETSFFKNIPSTSSNLMLEDDISSASQSRTIFNHNTDTNMKITGASATVDDVHENTTLQEQDFSNTIQHHELASNNENELIENAEAAEICCSLGNNKVKPGSNISISTKIITNDLPHQSIKRIEEINSDKSQSISIESSRVTTNEVVPNQQQGEVNVSNNSGQSKQQLQHTIIEKKISHNINTNKERDVTENSMSKEVKGMENHNEKRHEITEPISVMEASSSKYKEDQKGTTKDTVEGETNTIRIPIFNSLKLHDRQTIQKTSNKVNIQDSTQTDVLQTIPDNGEHSLLNKKNSNGNNITVTEDNKDSLNKTTSQREQVEDEDLLQDSFMINSDEDNQKESDGVDINGISREATPSLKNHFPSKKTRKLVSRLHNFSAADLAAIPIAERRNLRVELLDFMMKLEYYNTDEM